MIRLIRNIIEAFFFLGGGGGGGEVGMSLVWISKATVLCIEDPGFFNGGWLMPIFIGHQTIHLFILSCPTFVPKHGNLGRAKAGWLHKVFVTYVFLYFWDYSHISICLSKYYMECSKGGWLASQSTSGSPGSALEEAMSLSLLYDCICNVVCPHFNCFNYVPVSRPSCRLLEFYPNNTSLF